MKIIFDTTTLTDNVMSITASSEDASFPVTNTRDNFTTNLWKASTGVTSATITLGVSSGSAVEVLNTNATSVSVSVGTGGYYTLESGYSEESPFSEEAVTQAYSAYNLPGVAGRLWADYVPYSSTHTVTITLTAATTLYAGIVRAGNVLEFTNPTYAFKETSKDYSIEVELSNGADYYRKRNVVRTFSGISLIETRANAFLFKMGIFDNIGPMPLAMRLTTNVTDNQYILFAKRMNPPQLTHLSPIYTQIDFDLKEVI